MKITSANEIYDRMGRLLDLMSKSKEVVFTAESVGIINEIADYAEQTEFYEKEKGRGKMFKDKKAAIIYLYLLDRIVNAPTRAHVICSIVGIMPFLRDKVNEEIAIEKGNEQ